MNYLKLLAKIKDDLEALHDKGMLPEMVAIPSDAEAEENQGLIEKLLGVPVKLRSTLSFRRPYVISKK